MKNLNSFAELIRNTMRCGYNALLLYQSSLTFPPTTNSEQCWLFFSERTTRKTRLEQPPQRRPQVFLRAPVARFLIILTVKYGLESPPSGEGSLTCKEAEKRIKRDGFRKHLTSKSSDKANMLMFLYGREFMVESEPNERKKKIREIINSKETSSILL